MAFILDLPVPKKVSTVQGLENSSSILAAFVISNALHDIRGTDQGLKFGKFSRDPIAKLKQF